MRVSIQTIVLAQTDKFMNTSADKVSNWLKDQIDKKFCKDMGYKTVNCWLSPDRPHADVVVECVDQKNEKVMYRFMVVT